MELHKENCRRKITENKLQEESCQDMIVEIVEIGIMKSNEIRKGGIQFESNCISR